MRYYNVTFKSEAYELEEESESDYGTLAAGSRVLDAQYRDLSPYKPGHTPRWYIPNSATTLVPVELVLHASFEMEDAQLPQRGASSLQRQAVGLGAVVLSEADHDATMEELKRRKCGE